MKSILETVFDMLTERLDAQKRDINRLTARTERAEECGAVPVATLAEANATIADSLNGYLYFISNGRKSGEGAGLGTGVVAYFNNATSTWKRVEDNTDVAI